MPLISPDLHGFLIYTFFGVSEVITKGIQKVRSFWGKMTSQTKKFVVMIKLTIIEVSTKNIMLNLFLVSFLEFCKHQYPTPNMETTNTE